MWYSNMSLLIWRESVRAAPIIWPNGHTFAQSSIDHWCNHSENVPWIAHRDGLYESFIYIMILFLIYIAIGTHTRRKSHRNVTNKLILPDICLKPQTLRSIRMNGNQWHTQTHKHTNDWRMNWAKHGKSFCFSLSLCFSLESDYIEIK